MEVSGVKENEEECVRLYLEDLLRGYQATDIRYLAEEQRLIVHFSNDQAVDNVLEENFSFNIEEKNYRARRLYMATLLDVNDADLALSYLDTHIGSPVYHHSFPDERRLVVAFDAVKAIENLSKQEHHVIQKGLPFRMEYMFKTQDCCKQPECQQQPQINQQAHKQQPQENREMQIDLQREKRRRQLFLQQQKRKQLDKQLTSGNSHRGQQPTQTMHQEHQEAVDSGTMVLPQRQQEQQSHQQYLQHTPQKWPQQQQLSCTSHQPQNWNRKVVDSHQQQVIQTNQQWLAEQQMPQPQPLQYLHLQQQSSRQKQQLQQQPLRQQQQQQQKQHPLKQQQQRHYQQLKQAGGNDAHIRKLLVVTGISLTTSQHELELELTKQWRKTGIEYDHVDYNPSTGVAVVSLKAAHDVHAALQAAKGGIQWEIEAWDGRQQVCDLLGDIVLLVDNISTEFSTEALWCWMKVVVGEFAHTIVYSSSYSTAVAFFTYFTDLSLALASSTAKMHAVDGRRLHITAARHTRRAIAINVPDGVSSSMLKDLLEDSQNGGQHGFVACLEMTDHCTATITFCDEHALSHAMDQKNMLSGKHIILVPLLEDLGPATSSRQLVTFRHTRRVLEVSDTAAYIELMVSGFDSTKIDESDLRHFLSQKSMSGGGELMSLSCSEGYAVATFVESECASSVYQRYLREGLELFGQALKVSLKNIEIRDDARKNQLLLTNIGAASDDSIKYWLWGLSDVPVSEISFVFIKEDTELSALVNFKSDVDFRRLIWRMKSVCLDGILVKAELVSRPKSVLADNVPNDANSHLVELCFRRFGNLAKVRQTAKQQWVVKFSDYKDADCACQEKIIFHGDVELKTSLRTDYRVQPDARKKGKRGQLLLPLNFLDKAHLEFALAKRKEDLIGLLEPFASTISTNKNDDLSAVVCSLSQSDPTYLEILQRWPTLKDTCNTFFASIQSKSITVSKSVYNILETSEKFLNLLNTSHQDQLVTSRPNKDGSQQNIIVAGTSANIGETFAALQLVVKDISDSVERSKQCVTFVTDRLTESSLKFIDKIGFCKSQQACCRDLKAELDWDSHVIRFKGVPADVASAAKEIQNILKSSTEEIIKLSDDLMTLFAKKDIRDNVDEHLKQKNLANSVMWYLKPAVGLCVRGTDASCTHEAAVVIQGQFVETSIKLDAHSEQLINSEKWDSFYRDLIKKYHNMVLATSTLEGHQSGLFLRLSCSVTDSERILVEINRFLRQYTQKKDLFRLPCQVVRFITTFMTESLITNIEKLQSQNFVKLQPICKPTSDFAQTGLIILGNQDGIIKAKQEIAHLLKTHKVCIKQHPVTSPGAQKHFKSHKADLERMGAETRTIMSVSSHVVEEMGLHVDEDGLQTASQISLPCGTQLHVLQGDIIQLNCDAIVNPANGLLQHTGGLAKVIADKGGQIILEECASYIRDHGMLNDGQVCVTAAGNLPCRMIIHAVGPIWQGGTRNEESTLFNAVQNVLATTVKHGLTSIAIPPISSGVFKYPLQKSTETIAKSALEFCKRAATSPKKIVLIDNKSDGAMFFRQSIELLVKKTSTAAVQTAAQGSTSSSRKALPASTEPLGNVDEPGAEKRTKTLLPLTFGNVVVELLAGSLPEQKVDVIINSVGPQLQLNTGVLSKSVGDAAGPDMQSHLRKSFPDGIKGGAFAVSEGFKLPCKMVLHCCCPKWSDGNGKPVLLNLLSACLKEAAQRGMSSVAIPAVGTGVLGFPPQESAKISYEAVTNFCRNYSNSSVRLIRLVVFGTPDLFAAYREQHLATDPAGKESATLKQDTSAPVEERGTLSAGNTQKGVIESMAFSLTLDICGTESGIADSIEAITKYCLEKSHQFHVQDDEGIWSTLSNKQMEDLVKQCVDEGVKLEYDRQGKCVVVSSLDRLAAHTLHLQVKNILDGQKFERLRQETLTSRWQWQLRDDKGQWKNYATTQNALLELAFQAGQASVDYTSSGGTKYVVNVKDMKSYINGNISGGAEVQRVDKEQRLPDGWTYKQEYLEEIVQEGCQEYGEVKDSFFKTAAATLKIIEIKRVQNPTLLKQFELQTVSITNNMDSNSTLPVERKLWHGPDEDSLKKICNRGFDRSYCGVNGTVYGQGVYFARDSSYSANTKYSKPNNAGVQHMIYSRVLTGEFELGKPSMRTPPPRQNGKEANYDTTVDNVSSPSIFVIYHDTQAYPAYIVKFRTC